MHWLELDPGWLVPTQTLISQSSSGETSMARTRIHASRKYVTLAIEPHFHDSDVGL